MADIMVTLQKLANENTAKTFEFNREEAKTARNWQTQMSNTAHQREVKDLKAAGLNPVLSANSGAQSYSTQSASGVADSAVNALGNVESSRNSAAATRYAANQSYKASQLMANAQAYSAQMAYAAQKYASDRRSLDNFFSNRNQYKVTKLRTDADRWIAVNKQASSIGGFLDKYLGSKSEGALQKWIDFKNDKYSGAMFTGQAMKSITPANCQRVANSIPVKLKMKIQAQLKNHGYMVSDYNVAQLIHALATGNPVIHKLIREGSYAWSAHMQNRFK